MQTTYQEEDFKKDFFFDDSHVELPTVRIIKIELKNFKSVKHIIAPSDTKSKLL